ncbi:GntR family transcriptional regulator [Enterovirga sp.]|uniref:GntR family transcriptional regulator n=1 Tax=Enterovirga sp. TaxID=2026350 RepID=UPI002BDD41C7|nr:GntR family transcriptional regulator [Enterovirga sp.]HMO28907.1 GntR family transcriptional regulator [Enterovirga sp.]
MGTDRAGAAEREYEVLAGTMKNEQIAMHEHHDADRPVDGERLSDKAYRKLRDGLIRLEFEPMEPLNERALSQRLGVGIAPIREALRRLERERLVTIYPRRGIFASEIVITDQQAIREVRYEMEGLAGALAAVRGTKEEAEELVALADALYQERVIVDKMSGDARFHRQIYAMARNSFLLPILEMHFNLSLRLWHFCRRQANRRELGPLDQRPVARAIADRDPQAARALLGEHVTQHSDLLREMLL